MFDIGLTSVEDVTDQNIYDEFHTVLSMFDEANEALLICNELANALTAFDNTTSVVEVVDKYGMSPALEALIGNNFATTDISLEAEEVKQNLWKRIVAMIENIWQHIVKFFNKLFKTADYYIPILEKRVDEISKNGLANPVELHLIEDDWLDAAQKCFPYIQGTNSFYTKIFELIKKGQIKVVLLTLEKYNATFKPGLARFAYNDADLKKVEIKDADKAITLLQCIIGFFKTVVKMRHIVSASNTIIKTVRQFCSITVETNGEELDFIKQFRILLNATSIIFKRVTKAVFHDGKECLAKLKCAAQTTENTKYIGSNENLNISMSDNEFKIGTSKQEYMATDNDIVKAEDELKFKFGPQTKEFFKKWAGLWFQGSTEYVSDLKLAIGRTTMMYQQDDRLTDKQIDRIVVGDDGMGNCLCADTNDNLSWYQHDANPVFSTKYLKQTKLFAYIEQEFKTAKKSVSNK